MSGDRDYLFMGIEPDRLERARIYVAYREGPAPAESTEPVKRVCVCSKGHRLLRATARLAAVEKEVKRGQ